MDRCFFVVIFLSCLGCSPTQVNQAASDDKPIANSPDENISSIVLSDDVLIKFAKELQHDIMNDRRSSLLNKFDWNRFIKASAINGLGFQDPEGGKLFTDAFIKVVSDPNNPRHALLFAPEKCDFIKILTFENKKVIVLRYIRDEDVTYMYYYVALGSDGELHLYDVSPGVWAMSITSSSDQPLMILSEFKEFTPLGKYETVRKLLADNSETLKALASSLENKNRVAHVEIYRKLPKQIQDLAIIRFNYLESCALIPDCAGVTEDDYKKLVRAFPSDVGMLKILRNYYLSNKKFEQALQTVDQVDQFFGGEPDPAGNICRFWIAMTSENYRLAKAYALKVSRSWPEWPKGTLLLFESSLLAGDHPSTLQALKVLHSKFQINVVKSLEEDPLFEKFKASPEYAAWKKENDAAAAQEKQ